MPYYIVVTEWLYPTESGRDACDTYSNLDTALAEARKICDVEARTNFLDATKCDPTPVGNLENDGGCIVTDKMGMEEWYFSVRVIKVIPLQ